MKRADAENIARSMLYPDLRGGWKNHEKMLSLLTRTILRLDDLASEGVTTNEEFATEKCFWEPSHD